MLSAKWRPFGLGLSVFKKISDWTEWWFGVYISVCYVHRYGGPQIYCMLYMAHAVFALWCICIYFALILDEEKRKLFNLWDLLFYFVRDFIILNDVIWGPFR